MMQLPQGPQLIPGGVLEMGWLFRIALNIGKGLDLCIPQFFLPIKRDNV